MLAWSDKLGGWITGGGGSRYNWGGGSRYECGVSGSDKVEGAIYRFSGMLSQKKLVGVLNPYSKFPPKGVHLWIFDDNRLENSCNA